MKTPHLLRVTTGAKGFRGLLDAAREAGFRVGWLDLTKEDPVAPGLREAAGLGVARAVAAGPETTVAVKRRRGPAVLHDLLREHFLGCRLVLVGGVVPEEARVQAPELEEKDPEKPEGSWVVTPVGGSPRLYSTAGLVAALRRPHPWPTPEPPEVPVPD